MKNKILSLILMVCLIIPCMFVFTACGPSCEHDFQVTRQPTKTVTGQTACTKCGENGFEFPILNDTDYEAVGTNPDYKIYTYTKNGKTYSFSFSNFEVMYDENTQGYEITEYTGSSSSIIIPETYVGMEGVKNVTAIGGEVFKDKTNITSVTLPNNLKKLGDGAFRGCTGLTSISIPDRLIYLGNYVFEGCSLITEVVVPTTVTRLGGSAFENMTALEKLSIPYIGMDPNSPSSFGYIFGDVNTNNSVPSTLKEVIITGDYDVKARAFEGATHIEKVTFTGNVTTIKQYAFYNCTALKEVVLPESVVTIEGCVFENCGALESIVIPKSVETIGNAAFYECNALESVYFTGNKTEWNAISIGTYNDNNADLNNATRYYYSETKPTAIDYLNNNRELSWHFNSENEPELWTMNFTNSVSDKTYTYSETIVQITNEYWAMLKSAEEQGMLNMFFETQAEIDMVVQSATKDEYEYKLALLSSAAGEGLSVSFADGKATLSQGTESATPLDYIEIDNVVYYTLTKTQAFICDTENSRIYEQTTSEYITVKHTYTQNTSVILPPITAV